MQVFQGRKYFFHLPNAFQPGFAGLKLFFEYLKFVLVRSFHFQDGLQFFDGSSRNALIGHFLVYFFEADFIQFIYGHGDVGHFIGFTNYFGDAGQNFSVVKFHLYINPEPGENGVNHLYQFNFVEQGITAYHIHIALVKLPVAAFLWSVGTPNRLHLVSFKREGDFIAVLHYKAGKRYREVVTQAFFRKPGCQSSQIPIL